MNQTYICYCGLYCENCAVMANVAPAAKALYEEMRKAGFEEVISFIPGGDGFWPFLKGMAEDGLCISCKDGSGNPGCAIRLCAEEKAVEVCALCESYPCEKFDAFFQQSPVYLILKQDNDLLREQGLEAWGKLQDERRRNGFVYSDDRNTIA
ncbi:MAG: DUF3795 domain-containing protein [Clostridiales bacterium]|nr:DUF3795 domain-containing protein [Clostridiales bacterium]